MGIYPFQADLSMFLCLARSLCLAFLRSSLSTTSSSSSFPDLVLSPALSSLAFCASSLSLDWKRESV